MHKFLKIFLIYLINSFILIAVNLNEKGYFIKNNNDGTYTLHINLNYQNLSQKVLKLEGPKEVFTFYFPFPRRFIPLKAKLHLVYYTSPTISKEKSALDISLNQIDIYSTKLKPTKKISSLEIALPIKNLKRYNLLNINLILQRKIGNSCQNSTTFDLWSKIYLYKSYIEIVFTYKLIPNTLEALQAYIYDTANIYKDKINIVINPEAVTNRDYLNTLALLVGFLAKIYKYSDVNINIIDKPASDGDNYIVGLPNFVEKFTNKQIQYNVFITENKINPFFKNIILTGDNYHSIENAIIALFMGKFAFLKQSGLKLSHNITIPKLPPYSGPGYLPLGKRIYFKDLGFKTTTLSNKDTIKIPYKIYPDTLFGDKDKIKIHLNLSLPTLVDKNSALNIFGEVVGKKIFLLQIPAKKTLNLQSTYYFYANILPKGNGFLSIEPNLIPLSYNPCIPTNNKNLLVTIGEDSYIELPDGIHITEMPYLEFFGSNAYPYSIYSDLQDTTIILTKINNTLLSTALKVIYFIVQRTQYPPFYVNLIVAKDIKPTDLKRNLIVVGPYTNNLKQLFSAGAISILGDGILNFREILFNNSINKKINKFIKLSIEGIYTPVLVEMFESPYKKEKTVMLIYSEDSNYLLKFTNFLFSLRGSYWFKGDTILYVPEINEIYNYNINDKYIVGNASPIIKFKYNLAIHPYKYVTAVFLGAFTLGIAILVLLNLFKRKHHRDAE